MKKETLNSLNDLYIHDLQDMHNAEVQLTKALPKLAKKASSPQLRSALEEHLRVTEEQVNRIEKILHNHEQKPDNVSCEGIKGIIKEGSSLLQMKAAPEVMDAGLIEAAQRAEHYEIAAYGTLCTFAERLGQNQDLDLLQQTLEEEKEADKKLTEIAESGINEEAQTGESEFLETGSEDIE